jgi:NADPH-dependent curcumin reductase CurA
MLVFISWVAMREDSSISDVGRRVALANRPIGMVDEQTTRLEECPVPKPGPDEALVRVRYLSIDPGYLQTPVWDSWQCTGEWCCGRYPGTTT